MRKWQRVALTAALAAATAGGVAAAGVAANAPVTASTTAESRFALVASPGLAVWMAPSASRSSLATAGRS